MESDLITVIIPCYNQANFLGEAVESVRRQTHACRELIVVDDGSTDDTALVASQYPDVRLLRQANRGLAAARNCGLAAARGQYLVFLDADDRLCPHALERGLSCLTKYPQAAFAYGKYLNITADGAPLSPSTRPCVDGEHYLRLLQANYIGMHAAVIYRREVFDAVGIFDESLKACEDYDLYLRITKRFPIRCYPEVVAEYRQHGSNMTRDMALMLKAALDVLDSQREHVRGNRRYEEAMKAGVVFWRNCFGEKLIDDVLQRIHSRDDWRSILRGAYILARYYPQGIVRRARHKRLDIISNLSSTNNQ